MAKTFPPSVSYDIPYDTTKFIEVSIKEVIKTLRDAMILVILVVYLFLQSWRATLIPAVAVPVSLIGTFAGMPRSDSPSTRSRCSAWSSRSGSWSMTRSWWWRMWSGI